jgi:hypothetical protein
MKLNLSDRRADSLIHHIILNGAKQATIDRLCAKRVKDKDIIVDIVMTLNGDEVDIEKFCEHWQRDVNRQVRKHAEALVNDKFDGKFDDIDEALTELQAKLHKTIKQNIAKWEKGGDGHEPARSP